MSRRLQYADRLAVEKRQRVLHAMPVILAVDLDLRGLTGVVTVSPVLTASELPQ